MIGPRPGIKDEQAGVSLQWFKEPYHEQSQGWIGAVSSDYIVLPVDDYHLSSQCLSQQMFVTTKLLSRQIFVSANIILSWQNFCHVMTNTFVMIKHVFCCDKSMLVATKLLSWQKLYLWQLSPMIDDKHTVVQDIIHDWT